MAMRINLSVGWTQIAWLPDAPDWTNQQFLDDLANKGFDPATICRSSGGLNYCHDHGSPGEIWKMEVGRGYQLKVLRAGPYDLPGGQVETIKEVVKEVQFLDIQAVVDWIKTNPVLGGLAIAGGLYLLAGRRRLF